MKIGSADEIIVIGCIVQDSAIAVSSIIETLETSREKLSHGDTFTGKPGTQIYSNDSHVVKLHTELKFTRRDAERWIQQKLEQERGYHLYPPAKTWFLIDKNDRPIIANITPLLTPLHLFIEREHGVLQLLDMMVKMYQLFFRIAASHHKLLDCGLSNFAIDNQDNLYYLDDDIYEWDQFTAFCNHIGVIIRQLPGTQVDFWNQLGKQCKASILKNFEDRHQLIVALEQLRGVFVSNGDQAANLAAFIDGFYDRQRAEKASQLDLLIQKANQEINQLQSETSTSDADPVENSTKLALLADVHANLPALEGVLKILDENSIHQAVLLGDLVGYGPHPNECIELLKDRGYFIVKGNHDHGVASGVYKQGFSMNGRFVAEWSRDRISKENLQWLDELPPYIQTDHWLALHGAPMDKSFFNGYVYQMTYSDNLDNLQARNIKLCFHGHTHVQGIYYRRGKQDTFSNDVRQSVSQNDYSLVCPGAIGQPRGNIPGAEYAILDFSSGEIEFFRINYDMEKTLEDMRRYNFPSQLIERLPLGK